MKKNYLYLIKSFMACALLCSAAFIQAQTKTTEQSKPQAQNKGYYTQYYGNQPDLIKKAQQWAESGEWRNGFVQAKPHSSVNLVDFYLQYQKNPTQWKALFEYLSHTDLLAISKGKHKIPGTQLVVSVEDSKNGPLAKRKSEMTRPATMAVMIPFSGVTPDAIPNAMAKGRATMPTMIPAMRSDINVFLL